MVIVVVVVVDVAIDSLSLRTKWHRFVQFRYKVYFDDTRENGSKFSPRVQTGYTVTVAWKRTDT